MSCSGYQASSSSGYLRASVRQGRRQGGTGGVPGHFRGPLGAPLKVDQVLALGAPAAPVAGHLLDDCERLLQQHAAIRLRVEELRQVRIQRLLSTPRRASSAPPLQLPRCARTSAQRALAALRMRCSDPGSIDRKSGTRRRALPWPSSARPCVPDRPHTAQSEQFKSAPPCRAACYAPGLSAPDADRSPRLCQHADLPELARAFCLGINPHRNPGARGLHLAERRLSQDRGQRRSLGGVAERQYDDQCAPFLSACLRPSPETGLRQRGPCACAAPVLLRA